MHNPVAGRRRGARVAEVRERLLAYGCTVRMLATQHAGHAEQVLRGLGVDDVDIIAVAGGDGTINDAINGLGDSAPVLAVIPNGTANVLAHELALPMAPARIAALIAEGQPEQIYGGRVNGRRFMMMAGVGYDAHVVESVTRPLKRRLGKLAYVWRSLSLIGRFDFAPYQLKLDGETCTAASAVVANGRYYAGRYVCAPEGRLDIPGFHVCLFTRSGAWNVVRYGTALLANRLPHLKDVVLKPALRVEITGNGGEPVQADGDIIARLPATITADDVPVTVLRRQPAGR